MSTLNSSGVLHSVTCSIWKKRNRADYVAARRGQMRYDEHLARGLPIGSGRAEAACKTVVGRRLKCTGMRWSVAGANPVLWVRCANLSGWLDDYWDQRLGIAA